ncbi:type IV secretory system conjugative DNA transfer family protein [uncultured Rubinisphaera sp.]|uniref:type IV secretory system conjugative DNA transfer family protein n=1 Tax=uncultured Rubinisphaera sp. TaxID=1678686 RepID=UPI0030D9A5AC
MSQDLLTSSAAPIKLGRPLGKASPFGFSKPESQSSLTGNSQPHTTEYRGDSHLITVAPTGRGKGVSSIVPTLLDYPGSVIVFDPKGENMMTTRRRREEMGQRVIVFNPFNVLTDETDSLNPLDLLQLDGADIESDAQMLAQMFATGNRFNRDPFWDNSACGILSGLIAYFGSKADDSSRTVNAIHEQFHADDVVYQLAVLLDNHKNEMPQFAYREIAAFLQHPEKETRPSVQSTVASYLKCLAGGKVPEVLKHSSFSLQDFVDGEPISIYIIIPPSKLVSHRNLLRLLIATLLGAVLTRENRPEHATLFLLDEAAQLGHFPLLEQAITLCRGYGLKVWSFWQDLSQLKEHYPETWKSILNNCDIKQIFGISGMFMAQEWSSILEHDPRELLKLADNEHLLIFPDGTEAIQQKLNYLNDPEYAGLFDDNPRYSHTRRIRKRPEYRVRKLPLPEPPEKEQDDDNKQSL